MPKHTKAERAKKLVKKGKGNPFASAKAKADKAKEK